MAGLSSARPAEVVLAARVARQYYLDRASKVEIADSLGISRFRVARLLEAALDSGMVRIEIGLPAVLDVAMSARHCSTFGLQHAFVIDVPEDDENSLRRRLGEQLGIALQDIITPADVVGISWARSLSGLAGALTHLPPCPVIQLTGALSRPDGDDLLHLVRAVARVGGGQAHVYYAPLVVGDTRTANAIRRQADVARAIELVPTVTVALVGIGSWSPGLSTIHDALSATECADLATLGCARRCPGYS